jgi:hypothetical protein
MMNDEIHLPERAPVHSHSDGTKAASPAISTTRNDLSEYTKYLTSIGW